MTSTVPASQVFQQTTVATLPAPWSMTFLPDGDMLVTERPPAGANLLNPVAEGHIRLVTQAGSVSVPLTGVPDNVGVLDVELSPNFAQDHVVYFSYLVRDPAAPRVGRAAGEPGIDPAGVSVARAVLDLSNASAPALTSASMIWHQFPKVASYPGSGEPGGRIAFSPDGNYLYISSGDRQEFAPVQSLDDNLGKMIRLYPDGTVPADNPFADVAGALPDIWTLGHRNPYGLVFGTDGQLWENEMGPMGGDELNVIQPGVNYGWPNVSYGNNYDGGLIPKPSPGDGYGTSALTWTPVIAPSGMISYTGGAFPDWQGDLILSGLQSKGLVIVDPNGTTASELERIDFGVRTRDVVQGPDGSLWVLFDQPDGRLVKLSPLPGATTGSSIAPPSAVTPLPEGNHSVTVLTNGNSISVGVETLTGGTSDLKAQLYDSTGHAVGSSIILIQTTAGDQGQAAVLATASGGFDVVYGSRSFGPFNYYLQAFQSNGTASGSAIQVNSSPASFHSPPAITALSNGNLAVTWLGGAGSDITDVRVQLFAANGTKIGGEILASDHPESGKIGEHIVALSGGGFAISWTDYSVETDVYGSNAAVRAQVFDANGNKVGSALTVNTVTLGNQDQSSLTALPTGGFVATWHDDGHAYGSSTGTEGIWAQLIDANGSKVGTAIHVSDADEYGYAPSVTTLPGVGFAIAWQTSPSNPNAARDLMSRLFEFNGRPMGPEFTVATGAAPGFPTVAGSQSGDLIFGWTGSETPGSNDHIASYHVAIGTSGSDTLTGSANNDLIFGGDGNDSIAGGAGTDILNGGAGVDHFIGRAGDLAGDTILDLAIGEQIIVSDASIGGFSYQLSGSTLNFTGGQLTLGSVPAGTRFSINAAGGGGVALTRLQPQTVHDTNGDGHSDIFWRSTSGQFSDWLAGGHDNGVYAVNDANALTSVPLSWKVAAIGDVDGDGRADMIWRNDNGQFSDWLAKPNGGFVTNDTNAFSTVSASWQVAGAGDFNGDGHADVLWRNNNTGQFSNWLGQANGGFVANDANALTTVAKNWQIASVGYYNGDGFADVLWRNSSTGQLSDWLGQAGGGFQQNDGHALTTVGLDWKVVGSGDFNGDGRGDILWRNSVTGQLSDWLAKADGGFESNDPHALTNAPLNWHVAGIGDENGDGLADILWRSDSGQISDWLGQSNGGFVNNDAHALTSAPIDWLVQSPDIHWF